MLLQVSLHSKLLAAHLTGIALPRICVAVLHVCGQVEGRLAADWTHLFHALLRVLQLDVALHPEEVLPANGTTRRHLVRVRGHVLAQVALAVEALAAVVTDVRQFAVGQRNVSLHVD